MSTQNKHTEYYRRNTSFSCPPKEYYNGDTPSSEDLKKYPEGTTPKEIQLGIVDPYYDKGIRAREAWGLYVVMHQGYEIDGEASPCWVWCLNYREDEPILRLCGSSYFPRALMAKRVGVKGRMQNKCNHKNCINPKHLLFTPFKKYMEEISKKRRPQPRDEFGRFLSPTDLPTE